MTRTLAITLGATPQIVTETIYGLATNENWIPDRLLLSTTAFGENLFRNGDPKPSNPDERLLPLLGENGRLSACLRSLDIDPARVEVTVSVPRLPGGRPIEDLRTTEEVAAFADDLFALLRAATAEPSDQVHLSIAGGRKSMSYIAGLAMSLVARPHDRLSHILVSPAEFENPNRRAFWWPAQSDPAEGNDPRTGKVWRALDAHVELHHLPLIPMQAFLRPATDRKGSRGQAPPPPSFMETVERAVAAVSEDTRLVVDTVQGEIRVADMILRPNLPIKFALFHLAALARKERWSAAEQGFGFDLLATGRDNNDDYIFAHRFRQCLEQAIRRKREAKGGALAEGMAAMEAEEKVTDRLLREDGFVADLNAVKEMVGSRLSNLRTELRGAFPEALHSRLVIENGSLDIRWNPDLIDIL